MAAAAMVATLPGRTHGLGLITEPLLAELALDRVSFAAINFWATLVGAAFCIPVGWALDRFGVRAVLSTVLLALGAVVLAMTGVAAGGRPVDLAAPHVFFAGRVEVAAVPLDLFLLVLLTRGLGQSALSVVSLALVGKVAGKQPGVVIGVYSFLVAVGFMAAFMGIKAAFEVLHADWRALWFGPVHLGKIQGAAQLLTVVASAAGPLVLAAGHRAYGNYAPVVQNLAIAAGVFAVAAFAVPLPKAAPALKA